MKIKTILSVLLALILGLTCLVSCNGSGEETTTNAPGISTESPDEQTTEGSDEGTTDGNGETVVERFDYFNSDISKYITIDPAIYKNMSVIVNASYEPTEENFQNYINELLDYYSIVSKVTDRAIVEGDVVYIYYEGYIDGELFEGGSNMDATAPSDLKIGSGSFIPGFEDNLIGVIPSETSRDNPAIVNASFPDSYHNADVAGKDAVFHVVVEYIAEETPSVYGEDFILNTLGFKATEDDVVAEFERKLMEDIETNNLHTIRGEVWIQLIDKLEVISYPEGEVDHYYNNLVDQYEYYMQYYSYLGHSFESLDQFVCMYLGLNEGSDWKAVTINESQSYVLQNLIFHGIAQIEGIEITEQDIQDSIDYYIKLYGYNYTEDEIIAGMGEDIIKENALFEKVSNYLASLAEVSYVEMDEE